MNSALLSPGNSSIESVLTDSLIHSDVFARQIIRESLQQGFRDLDDVSLFLNYGLKNVTVATKVNCRNGLHHCSQLDFVSTVLLKLCEDFLLWTNRAGSKTFLNGLIAWILAGQARTEISILGGSGEQSEKTFKAMNEFFESSGMLNELLVCPPLISKTLWKNKSAVNILTASQKSVRGGHPVVLLLDEIEEMDEAIYDAARQAPQSKFGQKSITGMYSTNHKVGGVMDAALAQANTGAMKLFKWCIWECLESCRDYSCSTCKIAQFCPGKHMKQADGYYKIDDFIKKLYSLSRHTLDVEWFCLKVGALNLIYGREFDPEKHIIDRSFNERQEVYLSIDWGGVNPFSLGVWQYFDDLAAWVRVDEIYEPNTTNTRLIKTARSRPWWDNIYGMVGDPSRPDLITEWWDALQELRHSPEIIRADNSVEDGIEDVKNALAPVLGTPKLYFNRKCINVITEIQAYGEKNGKPIKEKDHAMDDVRYFTRWKIGKKQNESAAETVEYDVSPD